MIPFRFRNFGCFLLLLLLIAIPACSDGQPSEALPFLPPPVATRWQPAPVTPRCVCAAPGDGRFDVRLSWGGKYLAGRAKVTLEGAVSGAQLVHDPRIAIQKTSWPRGADCSDPVTKEGCIELPAVAAGTTLEFEFGFRHEPWSETTRLMAFAFPTLFAVTCPAHCRRPLGRWPAKFSMRRPAAPTLANAAGMPEAAPAGDELVWEQPWARLALVLTAQPPAVLGADLIIQGYAARPYDQLLPELHAFLRVEARPESGRLQVVFEPGRTFPWGLLNWRFVVGGSAEDARLSEISARMPAWLQAPVNAREGAVTACRLAELDPDARVSRLKKVKQEYLKWLQQRALADPVRASQIPTPAAYWTLLFAGTLQRSARGPEPGDCAMLLEAPQRPARLFHEILTDLKGRVPEETAIRSPAVTVHVDAIVPRKDTVTVKIYNKSRISLWVPIIYKTDKNSWNHWIFLPSTGKIESLVLQHTGKPVDILIDPENVTLALPFGWTEEGPPVDLDEPQSTRAPEPEPQVSR